MKKIFCVLAIILTLTGCSASLKQTVFDASPAKGAAGEPITLTGVSLAAENGDLSLWVDADNAAFEIRSKGGTVWRSLPENFDDAEWVGAMLKGNVASMLTVTALDTALAAQTFLSYGDSLKTGGLTFERLPNGIRFVFRFEKQGLTVPLDITLNGDGFTASVSPGDIVEDGDFMLSSVMLLPYFNSGTNADDGFLFYPDGSGAVSDYKKDYNNAADLTQYVYGFDRGVGTVEVASSAYGCKMPVYGAKTNGGAYLAVIEGDGEFVSAIQTGVMRKNNRYFKNGVIFTYRDVGKVYIKHNETTVNTSYVIPSPVTVSCVCSAKYILIEGDSDISDMAGAYRKYLQDAGVLTERIGDSAQLHLTLIGSLTKRVSFLGIPMNRQITLTTFDQAGEILGALNSAGFENISARFVGAQSGGYNNKWGFSLDSSLGGAKKWKALVENNKNAAIFPSGEILQIYNGGDGYSVSKMAARTTGNGVNFQYDYYLQDGTRNADARKWTLLSPLYWNGAFERFAQNAAKISKNLAAEDAGQLVYSEYDAAYPTFRDITGRELTNALRGLKSSGNRLALTGGNAYTWGIADTLYSVPTGASRYYIQSAEAPFYQMVIHGYAEYSGEPLNTSPDRKLSFLRAVEYGALPHYYGIYAPSSDLNRTILSGVLAANYLDWTDAEYAAAGELYKNVASALMVDHREVSPGRFYTQYDNGVFVTVDYNSRTFEWGWAD